MEEKILLELKEIKGEIRIFENKVEARLDSFENKVEANTVAIEVNTAEIRLNREKIEKNITATKVNSKKIEELKEDMDEKYKTLLYLRKLDSNNIAKILSEQTKMRCQP